MTRQGGSGPDIFEEHDADAGSRRMLARVDTRIFDAGLSRTRCMRGLVEGLSR